MSDQGNGTLEEDALRSLKEAADLIGLIEDLMHPASLQALSPVRASGMRLTLKNVQRDILQLHEALSTKGNAQPLRRQIEKQVENQLAEESELPPETDAPQPVRTRMLRSPIAMTVTTTEEFQELRYGEAFMDTDETL